MNSTGACFAPALTDLWRNWWTATSGRCAWTASHMLCGLRLSYGFKGLCVLQMSKFQHRP